MSHVPAPPPSGQPYGPGGYQPAPSMGGGQPAPRQPLPTTMKAAVGTMILGGVIQLLAPILAFLDMDTVREQARKGGGGTLTEEQIDAAVTIGLVVGVGMALVTAILWFVTAFLNAKGYSWARIVATCFAAIGVFLALAGLLQDNPVTTKIGNLLLMIIGVVAAVLLWLPDSNRWFSTTAR